MGGRTDSGQVVEIENPGGEGHPPEKYAGHALRTAFRAILVDTSEDHWAGYLGGCFRACGDYVFQNASRLCDRASRHPARDARRITDHPTDEWITPQVRGATPFEEKPKYLICDDDKQYGAVFERVATATGIEVIPTPFAAPRANAICEQFVGSLRREYLDQLLVIGQLQLIRVLKGYVSYFNPARPHQGIAQQIPTPTVSPPGEAKAGKVMAFPVLNRLHHDYRWAAAQASVGRKSGRI